MSNNNTTKWYAVYTKPRSEKKAMLELEQHGIEAYLPLQVTIKQWSDRKKKVEEPLFKSYLFVHIDYEKQYLDVLQTPQIIKFVKIGKELIPVREQIIQAIKLSLAHYDDIQVNGEINYKTGEPVNIIAGPLAGYKGVVITQKGTRYFAIEIEELGTGLLLNIPVQYLEKAEVRDEM